MEQIHEQPKSDQVIDYQMGKDQKVALMSTMLKEVRNDVLKQDLYDMLETQIPNPHPSLSEDDVTEQLVYGLLAHVRYGLSIAEAAIIVNEGQAVDWCFDKFIQTDDFKKATEDFNNISIGGNDITHNIDVNDIHQVASVIQPLIERFNKDLKYSPVCFTKMNYFTIKVKESLKHGENMSKEHVFQAGCGCMLMKYYGFEQSNALKLTIDGAAVKTVFEKYMEETVSAAIGKDDETTRH